MRLQLAGSLPTLVCQSKHLIFISSHHAVFRPNIECAVIPSCGPVLVTLTAHVGRYLEYLLTSSTLDHMSSWCKINGFVISFFHNSAFSYREAAERDPLLAVITVVWCMSC